MIPQIPQLSLFLSYALLLLLAMYIFVYIPNKKRHSAQKHMLASLREGDEVITIGGIVGIVGIVSERDGDYVTLLIDKEKEVHIRVVLYAIRQIKAAKP